MDQKGLKWIIQKDLKQRIYFHKKITREEGGIMTPRNISPLLNSKF